MSDTLAVLFGLVIGVLASVPVAMVIAALTTRESAQPRARRDDLQALDAPALDVSYVALPEHETSVIVWEARP